MIVHSAGAGVGNEKSDGEVGAAKISGCVQGGATVFVGVGDCIGESGNGEV